MLTPIPPIGWRVTGNHWLSLPCVHPEDGSIHALGILHRATRSAVEFAGTQNFVAGTGPALLRPTVRVAGHTAQPANVAGQPGSMSAGGQSAARAGWMPTFTSKAGQVVIRGTLFAPFGRDADYPGAVYLLAVENGGEATQVTVALEGSFGVRQLRVRSARLLTDSTVVHRRGDSVVSAGSALPGAAAIAVTADESSTIAIDGASFTLHREVELAAGTTVNVAFYVAVAPEGDGAEATVMAMRRRGWRALLASTREALQTLEQTTGHTAIDRLVNDNLLFAYFYGVGRALDDARFYLVRSRAPWNGRGLTLRDWEALTWTIPAVQLADAPLARELLLRTCEVHGLSPGRGVNYLDGTLFEPGFSLEGAAAYAVAVERYIRETGDDQIVEEPVLADTLYASAEDIARRRHKELPIYSTEILPSGALPPMPYSLHANAVTALALDVLRRTLDEETAKSIEDPSAVRAAIMRQFTIEREGKGGLASTVDLKGGAAFEDDPVGSVLWLPLYDTVDRQDSSYRRTVRGLAGVATKGSTVALSQVCARLVGPEGGSTLAWLRRAPLDNGIAAEEVDDAGRAVGNGGDAALAGLLAYTTWYAVHALGIAS